MYEFNCNTDDEGAYPYTDLVFSTTLRGNGLDAGGALYGTTYWGGPIGTGALFRIDLSGNLMGLNFNSGGMTCNGAIEGDLLGLVEGTIVNGTSSKPVLFGGAQYGGINGTGWLWHFWWYI
jgi:uncharacterized repeat protein (TIGR03803 family)